MEPSLKLKSFLGLAVCLLAMGAALFLSARTLDYWQGWLFLAVFAVATTWISLYFMKNDPALCQRRMQSTEKRPAQRAIMSCLKVAFVALFVVAGFDHKLGWSKLPNVVPVLGDGMIFLSFYVFYLVFKANSFASSTIEIAAGQSVISTGPYGFVRHPMYIGGLIFLLGIPIALGSWVATLIVAPMLPALIWRIVDEERLLRADLHGYTEYCSKVKYRLIPGVF